MPLLNVDLGCSARYLSAVLALSAAFAVHGFTPLSGPLLPDPLGTGETLILLGDSYYRTHYDPADWSGSLTAYRISSSGEPGGLVWSTDQTFAPPVASGRWQTWRLAQGAAVDAAIALDADAGPLLSAAQQALLSEQAAIAGLPAEDTPRLLHWISGGADQALRPRRRLLGDTLNALPVLAGGRRQPTAQQTSADYESYLADREARMEPVLVLGGNDGFLRVFNTAGVHRYAFLPAALHSALGQWAQPGYGGLGNHRAGADGRISIADAKLGAHWSTLAAAGLGAGGRGLAVIRLFDAAGGDGARTALWEINASHERMMGHIYDPPVIARLHGRSVLVAGNGYGSEAGVGALLIFDLETGHLLKQLDVTGRAGVARSNGLSMPVLQFDALGEVTAAFAGDLHGQLWKFDLSSLSHTQWVVAHNGAPLFTAGIEQPIAMQPLLHPSVHAGQDLLLFSTGKLLEASDLTDSSVQAVYAVLDTPALPASGLTPERLLQQQLLGTATDPHSDRRVRTVSNAKVDWNTQYGWFLPLVENGQRRGERVLHNFIIQHGRLLFTAAFLNSAATGLETASWLMVLHLDHGGMPPVPVLDTSGDQRVDTTDLPVAGLELAVGLPGPINLLQHPPASAQPGCDGELYVLQGTAGMAAVAGQPDCQFRRILWRQLQ